MFPYPDIPAAGAAMRAGTGAQLAFLGPLAQHYGDLGVRLGMVHMELIHQTFAQTADTWRELAGCTDPFQLGSIAMQKLQDGGQPLRNYQAGLLALLTDSREQLARPLLDLMRLPGFPTQAG
ncbi:hypothetical protein [Massilia niastensis]|uniref:hypothetical protein n=1 Tax=Massilia niastensis TaxID=544911 RepID=UPI00036DC6DB|nr:hypothetical protein [Massilia niastensis]